MPESGTCEPTKRIGGDGKSYTVTSKKTTPAPIKDKVEDEKPHITCGLPVDQEVAPNLDIPDQEPDSEMEGSKLLPRCPLPAYSDAVGHVFQFLSDSIPGLPDSFRSEATLWKKS